MLSIKLDHVYPNDLVFACLTMTSICEGVGKPDNDKCLWGGGKTGTIRLLIGNKLVPLLWWLTYLVVEDAHSTPDTVKCIQKERVFSAVLFIILETQDHPQWSSIRKWINHGINHTMGYYIHLHALTSSAHTLALHVSPC